MYTVFGLVLQALSALPPFYLVCRPDPIKFAQETGIPTGEVEKLSWREKAYLVAGLGLLFVGTSLQIAGALAAGR